MILIGGSFNTIGGQPRGNLGRVNSDGSVDVVFNPSLGNAADAVALQPDGSIIVGGSFSAVGGQNRNRLSRLPNTTPATQSLTVDGSNLTWMRGGSSPECWRATFESSSDGVTWTSLGEGARIPGGWQLTGLPSASVQMRARGYVTGGNDNGSAWFLESVWMPPGLNGPSFSPAGGGQFGFSASGPNGQAVLFETSTDLRSWTPLQTNVLGTNSLPFIDPQAGLFSGRFYRVRPTSQSP